MKSDKYELTEQTPTQENTPSYLAPTETWKRLKPSTNTLPIELTQMMTETMLLNIPNARYEAGKKFKKMQDELYAERQLSWLHLQLAHKPIIDVTLDKKIKYDFDESNFSSGFLKMCRVFSGSTLMSLPAVMLAVLVMMVMAVCGRYRVSCDATWAEAIELFALIAKKSGSRKSPFAAMLKKPFLQFEEERCRSIADTEKQMRQNEDIVALNKSLQKAAIKEITSRKELSLERQVQALLAIREQQEEVMAKYKNSIGKNPRLFFEKITDVSFVKNLREQGESLNCITAEGGFFESNLLKKNPQFLLSAHDMESIHYDSENSGGISVRYPAVSLLILVQSSKAYEFYMKNEYKEIGLLPRFFSLLETKRDENDSVDTDEFQTQLQKYSEKVKKLLEAHFTQNPNRTIDNIYLEDDAYNHVIGLMKDAHTHMKSKKYEFIESFLAKFHGHVVRLAAALHIFNCESNEIKNTKITLDDVIAASQLMNVVLYHACYLFDTEELEAYENAKKIVKWLIKGSKEANVYQFDSRQLQNGTKIPRAKAEAALEILKERNLIDFYNDPRTSIQVAVHPDFYDVKWEQILA